MDTSFAGMSTLRKKEEEEKPKIQSEQAKRLQDYLAQQYGAGPAAATIDKPKKKKKSKKSHAAEGALKIVDHDVSGFATAPHDLPDNQIDEEMPVIVNAEEAEKLKEQARKEKELMQSNGVASGWETVEVKSPPRRSRRYDSDNDMSPPRRRRHDSDNDASPPRRRHDSPARDISPPRRRQRHDSDNDMSPPRRSRRHDSDNDFSPPRRRQRHDSDNDASPPRRKRRSSSSPSQQQHDTSPPRRPPPTTTTTTTQQTSNRQLMSDGTLAGMVSGRELKAEMEEKRERERQRFADLDANITGRHATTVYRDAEGRRVTQDKYVDAREAARNAGKPTYDNESELAWGGGLKQKAEREEEQRRMREELAKPFARSHDADYDNERKRKSRWGDPMAHLVKKKEPEYDQPNALIEKEQDRLKRSGFVIPLDVPQHSWLRRGIGAPLNRYNIKPGRHWDGVDRSNGFERDMFKRQNELKRKAQEARAWNQGEM